MVKIIFNENLQKKVKNEMNSGGESMGLFTIVKKTLKPLARNYYVKKIRGFLRQLIYGNSVYRRIATNNYSTELLAIGEKNSYRIDPKWVTSDMTGSDYNCKLFLNTKLPFSNESQKFIYSAHCVEHLTQEALKNFIFESKRVLKKGGVIRLEAPDAYKLVEEYKANNKKFFFDLVREEKKELMQMHDIFLSLLSCYVDSKSGEHVPVKAIKKDIDERLKTLSIDQFFDWCISLQTEKQRLSGGHINAIYFDKLRILFEEAGFTGVSLAKNLKSNNDELNSLLSGIERQSRASYSLYVEAEK